MSARRERPGHGRAAKQSHELTSFQLTELHARLASAWRRRHLERVEIGKFPSLHGPRTNFASGPCPSRAASSGHDQTCSITSLAKASTAEAKANTADATDIFGNESHEPRNPTRASG